MSEIKTPTEVMACIEGYIENRLALAERIVSTIFVNLRMSKDIAATARAIAEIDERHWLETGVMRNKEANHHE